MFYSYHLAFSPGPPYELIDRQQCFILAPVVFLQGHFDGLLRHVLNFFALDLLVCHLLHAVLLFGYSSIFLLETQHEMKEHASTYTFSNLIFVDIHCIMYSYGLSKQCLQWDSTVALQVNGYLHLCLLDTRPVDEWGL